MLHRQLGLPHAMVAGFKKCLKKQKVEAAHSLCSQPRRWYNITSTIFCSSGSHIPDSKEESIHPLLNGNSIKIFGDHVFKLPYSILALWKAKNLGTWNTMDWEVLYYSTGLYPCFLEYSRNEFSIYLTHLSHNKEFSHSGWCLLTDFSTVEI